MENMRSDLRATNPHGQNCRLVPILRAAVTLLPLLFISLPLRAQQSEQGQQEPAATIKKDVNVVNVLATVRNKQGQIVTTLNEGRLRTARRWQAANYPLLLQSD